jgi:alpha-galactosidase
MVRWLTLTGLTLLTAAGMRGQAMSELNIPADAPDDAVMASRAEVAEMRAWVAAAFAGVEPPGAVRLEVRRQDHSHLHFGQSCIDTPMRVGSKAFRHGLGTHAFSEIAVDVPPGAKAFRAAVGVDNNADTGGARGTVQFSVEAGGRELLRTPTLRGGQEPEMVNITLPEGCREIVLKVNDGGDGVTYDQADWADARFAMADGSEKRLDENQVDLLFQTNGPPFSFVYGGRPSAELLKAWPRTVEAKEQKDYTEYTISWTDPATGLRVTAGVKAFKRYPAADWALTFENTGTQDTPIIADIRALDVGLRTGYARNPLILHQLQGDACGESSFVPFDTNLEAGKSYRMAPTGGRPSSISAFPWFNAQYAGRGAIVAIGWTGQWSADFTRVGNGPGRMTAGMEKTRLLLHPGEKIRTPRIVTLAWKGDRQRAHLQFRRLAMFHYAPRPDGRPLRLPVALQTFDRYWHRPGWATEEGQIAYAKVAHDLGCDTLWLDAAWFPGGFPNGVGSWFCEPKQFPRGLKPVTDETHRLGMKFILWFEPERVAAGSEIAREHPEFVFGGANGGLFKLNDPAARRWLTDLLSKRVAEYGLDVYRNDFNMDPLDYWRQNDAPDRQGMTEIRYVEGLYAMWDELRARHPGLWIDNCSSGGRRIDIEMCSRSVPLWRSDTGCSPGHPDWNHAQSLGLGLYVPLFTVATWSPEPYEARSGMTGGAICEWGYLEPGFPTKEAKEAIAEIKEGQPYWYGDFYPLTPANTSPDQIAAWQLHRADLNAGMALAFRRRDSNPMGLIVGLQGVAPKTTYRVEFSDNRRRKTVRTMTGKELLSGLTLKLPEKGSSLVVRYSAMGK